MANILVITDNAPALELVRSALVVAGHEVIVARDARPATRRHFDLAIVDLERYEVAAEARTLATKVVLFSGDSEDVTRERVASSGAQGYLRKLGPERLREDVQNLLELEPRDGELGAA
jgi:DNA-binding response OmpR family regulator